MLEIDRVQVKGKSEPETISTLVGDAAFRRSPRFAHLAERHAAMLAAYRGRRWAEAAGLTHDCEALTAGLRVDGLYTLYRERIADFAREPPPAEWTGVHVALTK